MLFWDKSWECLLPETLMSSFRMEHMAGGLILWYCTCLQCIFESSRHSREDACMGKIDHLLSDIFVMVDVEMHLGMNWCFFEFNVKRWFLWFDIAEVHVMGGIGFGFELFLFLFEFVFSKFLKYNKWSYKMILKSIKNINKYVIFYK